MFGCVMFGVELSPIHAREPEEIEEFGPERPTINNARSGARRIDDGRLVLLHGRDRPHAGPH